MLKTLTFLASGGIGLLVSGCASPVPPGSERGPNGTIAYDVLIEASAPGTRIEANGEEVGTAPLRLKIFGDPDGTFHDFGSYTYEIRALPGATNLYSQLRFFRTGHLLSPEDRIPRRIYFDMNRPPPPNYGPPGYYPPPSGYYGPPPAYYYQPAPYFYGPSFQFDIGPRHHGYRHHY